MYGSQPSWEKNPYEFQPYSFQISGMMNPDRTVLWGITFGLHFLMTDFVLIYSVINRFVRGIRFLRYRFGDWIIRCIAYTIDS